MYSMHRYKIVYNFCSKCNILNNPKGTRCKLDEKFSFLTFQYTFLEVKQGIILLISIIKLTNILTK